MEAQKRTIYQRIVAVAQLISPISKSKREGQQVPYAFRGIDDLFNNLQPLFATAGIFLIPEVLESKIETALDKNQKVVTTSILKIKWSFFGEDGDSVSGITVGEATDYSDKATNKATSASLKYFLMDCFCIPTSDIADSDMENPEKTGTTPQAQTHVTNKYTGESQPASAFKWADSKNETATWLSEKQFESCKKGIEAGEGVKIMKYCEGYKMKKEYSTALKEMLQNHGYIQ